MNVDKAHANRTLRRSPDWIGRNPVRLIPGDPAAAILGTSAGDPALVARLYEQLGLDLPLPAQYAHWIGGVLSGNFGYSYSQQAPVSSLLGQNLIWTIELTFASLVFALIFGTIIGVAAGLRRNTGLDATIMGVALVFLSMPSFWLGLLLILLISVQLHLLPVVSG